MYLFSHSIILVLFHVFNLQAACAYVSGFTSSGNPNTEVIFQAASAAQYLGCPIAATAALKQVCYFANSKDIFYFLLQWQECCVVIISWVTSWKTRIIYFHPLRMQGTDYRSRLGLLGNSSNAFWSFYHGSLLRPKLQLGHWDYYFFFVPAVLTIFYFPLLPSFSVPLYFIHAFLCESVWENSRVWVTHFLYPYWMILASFFCEVNSPAFNWSFIWLKTKL